MICWQRNNGHPPCDPLNAALGNRFSVFVECGLESESGPYEFTRTTVQRIIPRRTRDATQRNNSIRPNDEFCNDRAARVSSNSFFWVVAIDYITIDHLGFRFNIFVKDICVCFINAIGSVRKIIG